MLAVLVIGIAWGAAGAAPRHVIPREVLTYYYGWWGTKAFTGRNVHWNFDEPGRTGSAVFHEPAGGRYDSHDPVAVNHQMTLMHRNGITGLISSWWGRGGFDDQSLALLTDLAPRHHLAVTAYYETVPVAVLNGSPSAKVDAVVRDLTYLADTYGGRPAWLKVNSRPVIFVYKRAIGQIGTEGWWLVAQQMKQRPDSPVLIADANLDEPTAPIASAFAGVGPYIHADKTGGKSPEELKQWATAAFARWRNRWSSRIVGLTIMPGFGDDRPGASAPAVTRRAQGSTYQAQADAALAADPDWLLITSWNEWHEGSEIEPSVEHGDLALRQTRAIAARFRAMPPRTLSLSR